MCRPRSSKRPLTPHARTTSRRASACQNVIVIFRANGIVGHKQAGGIRGPISEEVDEHQAAEAPSLREADASPDCGVIRLLICGRWVQADERDPRKVRIPDPGMLDSVASL